MADASLVFNILARNETAAGLDEAKSSFSSFGDVMKGILGSEIVNQIGEFFSSSIEAADSASKVAAQTSTILAATGDAAGLTAAQVATLSDKYGELAGVTGESVQNSLNFILRNQGVQQAIGSNVISANQLTETLTDLAATMSHGGSTADSLTAASTSLSTALANPFNATKALKAAGDTLTLGQTQQLAAFKKAGDSAGAYKLVLGSLQQATAGAAAANTTPLQKLGAQFDDLKIKVGQQLMPIVTTFANDLLKLAPVVSNLAGAIKTFLGFIGSNIAIFGSVAGGVLLVVGGMKLWKLGIDAVRLAQLALNLVVSANPWVIAIEAVIAVLIYLMTQFSSVRTVVVDVVQDILRVLGDLAQFIVNTVVGSVEVLLHTLGEIPIIGGPFKTAANDVDAFRKTVDNAISAVQNLDVAAGLTDISSFLKSMTNIGSSGGAAAANGFSDALPAALGAAAPKAAAAVETLAQKVQAALTKFKNGIVQSFGSMGSVISAAVAGPPGSNFLVGNLQQQLNKAKQFVTDISTLRHAGLNATSLNELIAAGPDQGSDAARQLATSGLGSIAQVNSLESQFNTVGNAFATQTAKDEFGSTSGALKRNQVYLNFDMTGVSTDDFVKALRKAIRVKGGNVQTVLGGAF